jgi:predicted enzyme related to lactoylglutathione lyase
MADSTVRGHFVWHELMTTEVASAVAFYKKVVGWKTQAWEQDASYLMWLANSGPIGGVAKLAATAETNQPYWLPYVGSTDIEVTVNDAGRLGGKVVVPVTAIPNGGKYAVLGDPQGATFGVYAASSTMPAPDNPGFGDFAWHELATSDYQASFRFYQALFGWEKAGEHDMGEMGLYFMFGLAGKPLGGMYNKRTDMPTHWLSYAQVSDAKKAAKVASKAGGTVIHGPMQVPGGSWITMMTDPQGALNAVVSPAEPETGLTHEPAELEVAPVGKNKSAKKKTAKKSAKKQAIARKPAVKKKIAVKKAAKKKTVAKRATKKKAAKKK